MKDDGESADQQDGNGGKPATAMLERFAGFWTGQNGEAYRIEDGTWKCRRLDQTDKSRSFNLRWHPGRQVVVWGRSYFADPLDFGEGDSEISWYKLQDSKKKHRRFTWTRSGEDQAVDLSAAHGNSVFSRKALLRFRHTSLLEEVELPGAVRQISVAPSSDQAAASPAASPQMDSAAEEFHPQADYGAYMDMDMDGSSMAWADWDSGEAHTEAVLTALMGDQAAVAAAEGWHSFALPPTMLWGAWGNYDGSDQASATDFVPTLTGEEATTAESSPEMASAPDPDAIAAGGRPTTAATPDFGPSVPLHEQARKQVEYYFSAKNVRQDHYLRSLMDAEGWVSLSQLASFNRLYSAGIQIQDLVMALMQSQELELDPEQQRVRLRDTKVMKNLALSLPPSSPSKVWKQASQGKKKPKAQDGKSLQDATDIARFAAAQHTAWLGAAYMPADMGYAEAM